MSIGSGEPPTMSSNGTGAKLSQDAPRKKVPMAMEMLRQAARLITDLRIGDDRLLEALFGSSESHQSTNPLDSILKEEIAMQNQFQDFRTIGSMQQRLRLLWSKKYPYYFIPSASGGVLNIDIGLGLKIAKSHVAEIEKYSDQTPSTNSTSETYSSENAKGDFHEKETIPSSNMEESRISEIKCSGNQALSIGKIKQLTLKDGKVMLPNWASDVTSVLWIPVRAICNGISKVASQWWSIVEGLRTMALKLDFGMHIPQPNV